METDLPYPVRWKILQDENLGDFNVWMFQGLFFSLPKSLAFFFLLDDELEKTCLYSVPVRGM